MDGRTRWVTEPGVPAASEGAYMAWGAHGQIIWVIPNKTL